MASSISGVQFQVAEEVRAGSSDLPLLPRHAQVGRLEAFEERGGEDPVLDAAPSLRAISTGCDRDPAEGLPIDRVSPTTEDAKVE